VIKSRAHDSLSPIRWAPCGCHRVSITTTTRHGPLEHQLTLTQLRFHLQIPPHSDAVFERYSDSAAAFVVLDSNNPAVYKQLYRAAKAKLKLRLRATITMKDPVVPMPATVEAETPELPETSNSGAEERVVPRDISPPTPPMLSKTLERGPVDFSNSMAEIQRSLESLIQNRNSTHALCGFAESDLLFSSEPVVPPRSLSDVSVEEPVDNSIPVTRGAEARKKWLAELAGAGKDRSASRASATQSQCTCTSSFSVYCNNCNIPVPDAHYHCGICDDGDYDLCQTCIDSGVTCPGESHWMIKRFVENGKVINSTTETLAPKSSVETTEVEEEETEEEEPTRTCNSCIQGKFISLFSPIIIMY
jgi:next-to-BRCA1 protein 1